MGFICTVGVNPQASDCTACARPISPPSKVTQALLDMFCALKGATRTPWPRSHAQNAVVIQLLPAPEPQPRIDKAFIELRLSSRRIAPLPDRRHYPSVLQTDEVRLHACQSRGRRLASSAKLSGALLFSRCDRERRRVKREAGALGL